METLSAQVLPFVPNLKVSSSLKYYFEWSLVNEVLELAYIIFFSVDFSPEEDSKLIRKQLFRQLEPILGKTIFDGAMLFSPKPLAAEQPAVHDVKHPAVFLRRFSV